MSSLQSSYERYGPALRRQAQRVLRSRDDAEDMVQGLFVHLLQRGAPVPDLPYLYRAIMRRCLNWLRDDRNRQRLLAATLQAPAAHAGEPATQHTAVLLQLWKQLDDGHRAVVMHAHWDGMSQQEIAEVLDLSRKTVGIRLQRVRALARRLDAGEEEGVHARVGQ